MHGFGGGVHHRHLGKLLCKGKVTAVGFVDNQRDAMLMTLCG